MSCQVEYNYKRDTQKVPEVKGIDTNMALKSKDRE